MNEPHKILISSSSVVNSSVDCGGSKLFQLIKQHYSDIPIMTLQRKHFNDDEGKQCITDYGLQEDTAGLLVGVSTK